MTETETKSESKPEPKPKETILEMVDVSLRQEASKIGRLRRFSFQLPAGSLALVHRPAQQAKTLLVEAAIGTTTPRQGDVKFLGSSWAKVPYGKQMTMRSQVGRIFESRGWISNLSLSDNLKLMPRHHTALPESTIQDHIDALTHRFKIDLPTTRVAYVPEHLLRICQWIRAFLSNPKMLVAQSPLSKVPDNYHSSFLDAEHEHRKNGGATLWVTDNPFIWQRDLKGDVARYKISGERLTKVAS